MTEHPATSALRSGCADELSRELVATLADGEHEWLKDWRDLMVTLAPFHDCAGKLGLDVATTFRAAAALGPQSLTAIVIEFGERDDVTLASFAWRLVEDADGPAYRYDTPTHVADLEEWLSKYGPAEGS